MNDYAAQIRRLHDLGPRTSGSTAHHALIEDVAAELAGLGLAVERDAHTFQRWHAGPDDVALRIDGRDVAISSAWPYSGETPPEGVTAALVLLHGRRKHWRAAAGRIAVVEARNIDVPAELLLDSWGDDPPFSSMSNPVVGAELAGIDLGKARRAGVLGVVVVWRAISDGAAHAQYLPFTHPYQGLPAVWVPSSEADAVVEAARRGATATLKLTAEKTDGASMDTLWAVSPGSGPNADESVLVVTHSDGGNVVEENGHIGLLALARAAAARPHNRTIVFVYTAGHLRIPAVTKHGQATTAWLEAHPELWSPDADGLHAVAGLAIEHLGARHFATDSSTGRYDSDGTLEPELLYATTEQLAALVRGSWNGAEPGKAVPVKAGAMIHFGEGEPLFEHHIPAVALVTGPTYLLAEIDDDLVDIDALSRQVDSFQRLLAHLAGPSPAESFGTVDLPGKLEKLRAASRALRYIAAENRKLSRPTS